MSESKKKETVKALTAECERLRQRLAEKQSELTREQSEHNTTKTERYLLHDEYTKLHNAVVNFIPWASAYAKIHGLPEKYLFAVHYDLVKMAMGDLSGFTRYEAVSIS